ncbi:hypothetical protein [Sulfitobacter mediterraneus]|nr:hypothetical protein [Sulfitobacter mediterraneus]MBM1569391.1 hypothetical protein [Sulfitobacter mediterraneus]MBM1576998.1 hypothetical protein [Sulfitobacter mediterraneus]MBM1588290.1 hypothetical protein [Sulfitobacter mediterraneus]MBM1595824.1 hypothetical protein [Sulfitobacter mediterraneus]MBM1603499.1 hypothetical protein [Sulfitobacter mediterraneus]
MTGSGQQPSAAQRIDTLLDAELDAAAKSQDDVLRRTAQDFAALRCPPAEVTVNFSGGLTQRCWSVSRGDGTYRVVYLPKAGYFSLCVESDFGPLDIGVHGPALGCFGSV